MKKLKKNKTQEEKNQRVRLIKKRLKVSSLLSAGLIIISGLLFGAIWAGINLEYTFHTGIDYSGGYDATAGVYDFSKSDTKLTGTPNGDASKNWKLLQRKLDPLGQKNFYFTTIGSHSIGVRASQSLYNSLTAFVDDINREGGMFLLDNDWNSKDNKRGDGVNSPDLALQQTKDKKSYLRTPISNIFTSVNSTIDKKTRKPIISLAQGSEWSSISKALGKGQLYIWTDIGEVINKMRSYHKSISIFRDMIKDVQDTIDKLPSSAEKADARKVFDFTSSYNGFFNGNMLTESGQPARIINALFDNADFKWNVTTADLTINPNEGDKDKKKRKPIPANEQKYVLPFESTILTYFNAYSRINNDFAKEFTPYLLNWKDIKAKKTDSSSSNSFTFSVDSESQGTIIANLVKSGLSGIVFRVLSNSTVAPSISSKLFTATKIILYTLAAVLSIYLIFYFRSFGLIAVFTLLFAILMSLYVASVLSVSFTPLSFAAFIIGIVTIISGLILIIRRYKLEKNKNKLPYLTAFKIAIKQTLPFIVDGIVIFVILTLSIYWFSTGALNSFAITLLITLLITLFSTIFVGCALFYLIIKLNIFDKAPILDMQKSLWDFRVRKFDKKKASKNLIKKYKLSDQDKQKLGITETKSSDQNSDLWAEKEDDLTIEDYDIAPPVEKERKVKIKKFRHNFKHLKLFDFIKWTPIISMIIVIIGIVIFAVGKTNFDQTLQKGAVFTFSSQIYKDGPEGKFTSEEEKTFIISTSKDSATKYDLNQIRAEINVGKWYVNGNLLPALIISTNIKTSNQAGGFLKWLRENTSSDPTAGDSYLNYNFTKPVQATDFIQATMIALGVGIALIIVYIIFRFDWAQFISILGAGLFAVILSLSLIVIFQLFFSLNTIVILAGIWCFAIVNASIMMSKMRESKKAFNIDDLESFFENLHAHKLKINALKLKINFRTRKALKQRLKIMQQQNPASTIKDLKQEILTKWREDKKNYILYKKSSKPNNQLLDDNNPFMEASQAKKTLKIEGKKYKKFDRANNFLYKAANITIKKMLIHYLIVGIVSSVILIVLSLLSLSGASYFVALLIGILVSIYAAFVVVIPIWVKLEKYRAINKVKITHYLDSKRVNMDEQKVKGVNT